VSDRSLERAISDAYDQLTAWRWVARSVSPTMVNPGRPLATKGLPPDVGVEIAGASILAWARAA
jgi:hypothetical protein